MTELLGLGEQLVESLLDVVTNAIDQLGDAPGVRLAGAGTGHRVGIVSDLIGGRQFERCRTILVGPSHWPIGLQSCVRWTSSRSRTSPRSRRPLVPAGPLAFSLSGALPRQRARRALRCLSFDANRRRHGGIPEVVAGARAAGSKPVAVRLARRIKSPPSTPTYGTRRPHVASISPCPMTASNTDPNPIGACSDRSRCPSLLVLREGLRRRQDHGLRSHTPSVAICNECVARVTEVMREQPDGPTRAA